MACLGRSPHQTAAQAARSRRLFVGSVWGLASLYMVAAGPAGSRASAQDEPASQPVRAGLTLHPGATCLEHDRLVERVGRWLERDHLDARVRVTVRGDMQLATRVFFTVTLADTEPTERVLENAPAECDQLHSAVGLSIALAVEAIVVRSRERGAHPEPAPSPQPSAAPKPTLLHGEIAVFVGATVNVVPATALAAAPRLHLSPRPWLSIELAGLATHVEHVTISDTPADFSAMVLAGGLDVCVGGETAQRLGVFLCGGARGGAFTTLGQRNPPNFDRTRRYWAIVMSGQARAWILPSLAIGVSLEGLFALAARDLVFESRDPKQPAQIRSVPRIGLGISIGPVFRVF